ncbi:DUF1905 domain-containing protein [Frondihabitans australicus]|uniref:Uncharacterized protein DUF1905 n=1 Tax=Frondihabitans australicus TaxID=386892 RepID=A0A495IEL0_9MICO|nr:DUF1905 domain-containing protein [Frondihabitans australicus]RKR73446.1 uncharacterized protein DUF1905 [Frondihabitans australicus]
MRFEFSGEVYRWAARKELWTFVALPDDASDQIVAIVEDMTNGWGSVRVDASVGATRFRTSIFPDREKASYVLPIKKAVREAEGVGVGDTVRASVTLVDF